MEGKAFRYLWQRWNIKESSRIQEPLRHSKTPEKLTTTKRCSEHSKLHPHVETKKKRAVLYCSMGTHKSKVKSRANSQISGVREPLVHSWMLKQSPGPSPGSSEAKDATSIWEQHAWEFCSWGLAAGKFGGCGRNRWGMWLRGALGLRVTEVWRKKRAENQHIT